ncbi:MAG TPA: hypothetical protein VGG74_26405 [Kofleriaceae bacterium]
MTRSVWWFALVLGGCVASIDPSIDPTSASPGSTRAGSAHTPQMWRAMTTPMPTGFAPAVPQLMQDGTLIVQDYGTANWWKLTPDAFGQYDTGTWKQVASSNGYAPLFDAQAVLPDGRMIVEGGEYLNLQEAWTGEGAIYDPIADKWTSVNPPTDWTANPLDPGSSVIGDASGIVLPDGTFMLSNCCSTQLAKLDAATLTWTPAGQNKEDWNDEESWSTLFDGRIVTADANVGSNTTDYQHSEIYTPSSDMWTPLPDVPVELDDVVPTNPDSSSHEVGPEMTRPDGTIVAIGATPHNAMFDPASMMWTALPDTPGSGATEDGPGATLPNGNVIFATAPYNGTFAAGTSWYEWDGTSFTKVGGTTDDAQLATYEHFLVMLPTGELLHTQDNYISGTLQLYTPATGVATTAIPEILGEPELVGSGAEPPTAPIPTIYKGRSYTMPIARMNGIDLGATYGDDVQTSTDFPIVRVTASDSGHVWYCRTHDPTDRSTSPDEQGAATFDVPEAVEGGTAEVAVIANGIASAPLIVNIK